MGADTTSKRGSSSSTNAGDMSSTNNLNRASSGASTVNVQQSVGTSGKPLDEATINLKQQLEVKARKARELCNR